MVSVPLASWAETRLDTGRAGIPKARHTAFDRKQKTGENEVRNHASAVTQSIYQGSAPGSILG